MNTITLIDVFNKILIENKYKIVERSNLLSPYFKGEFNLSGAHNYLIPAVQSNEKKNVDKIGVVDLVVRNVDLEIIGHSNSHLLLFEMGVFGCFGYMENLKSEIENQLKVLFDFYNTIGLDNSKIYVTICDGGLFLDKKLDYDNLSYSSLVNVGFNKKNIISTRGRRNFMLSRGIDRLAGYNIEFFIEKNGSFIEIGSSNIYKFLNKLSYLKETVNNGVGCGVGFERLAYVLGDYSSVYDIEPYNQIYSEITSIFKINGDFLIKDKLYRIIEISKAILFILNDGIGFDNSAQGKKLKKYTAKLSTELDYISLDKRQFLIIVYGQIMSYYKKYNLNPNIIEELTSEIIY